LVATHPDVVLVGRWCWRGSGVRSVLTWLAGSPRETGLAPEQETRLGLGGRARWRAGLGTCLWGWPGLGVGDGVARGSSEWCSEFFLGPGINVGLDAGRRLGRSSPPTPGTASAGGGRPGGWGRLVLSRGLLALKAAREQRALAGILPVGRSFAITRQVPAQRYRRTGCRSEERCCPPAQPDAVVELGFAPRTRRTGAPSEVPESCRPQSLAESTLERRSTGATQSRTRCSIQAIASAMSAVVPPAGPGPTARRSS